VIRGLVQQQQRGANEQRLRQGHLESSKRSTCANEDKVSTHTDDKSVQCARVGRFLLLLLSAFV
jgi:hypothetical protein